MKIAIIVAVAENGVIGKNNQLPWHLPEDLKFFKNTTKGHYVIMGRKTFESIGKPLPDRINIVLTKREQLPAMSEEVIVAKSLDEAIKEATSGHDTEAFIVGGSEIFNEAMPITDTIYMTEIKEKFEGDTYFPQINPKEWTEVYRRAFKKDEKNKFDFDFVKYERTA